MVSANDRVARMQRITETAIKSVKQYNSADEANQRWRDSHAHWPELNKIVTNKQHLAVEARYNKASNTMDKAVKMYDRYKKRY